MSTETDLESLAGLVGLIDTTTTDGIPTLLAPRDGPLFCGLAFRVGRGDETLATAGITHLVEHLALYRLNMADLHHNGQTASWYTLFHATGTPDEVVDFLNGVCASLRDLPLDRLETEKEILRTEGARRESGRAFEAMGLWRYGAQGPGLFAYGEEGLPRLTTDDVSGWTLSRFVRDNAVLFLTADLVPDGLDLRLPEGRRFPVTLPPETLPHKPAWFVGAQGGAIVDGIVARSTAASLFAQVTNRTLFRRLRQERGLSYTAECGYEPVAADLARITAHADALPEKQDLVVRALVGALDDLRAGGFDDEDVAAVRRQLQQQYEVPDLGASMLPAVALNLLLGHVTQHPDELRAEQDAVTVGDLTAVARAFWDDALAQVPDGGLDWAADFAPAPAFSESEVLGFAYPHLADPQVKLIVADDGVSLHGPHGGATVRFEDCVLMSAFPDGGRRLVGRDGFRIVVEPTLYRWLTPEVVAGKIDAHVPHEVVQWLPPRADDAIPHPPDRPVTAPHFRVFPRWRGLGRWAGLLGAAFLVFAGLMTLGSAISTSDLVSGTDQSLTTGDLVDMWLVTVALWAAGAPLVWAASRRQAIRRG